MTSHRRAFRSSAIIGGASVVNMAIGIVKVKVLAVLLGPVGIGLMGLYQNIMVMAATFAACGMGSSGVRQLATSTDEAETLSIVRRALWLGNLILGIAGMAILCLLREPVAQWVFGDSAHSSDVGWLGVGLLLTVITGSHTALLQGLRRIEDLARVTILSGLVAAPVGIMAVYLLGEDGVLWFVLAAPAVNILVASHYTARLPRLKERYDLAAIQQQWLAMLKLGIPVMSGGLVVLIAQLAARSIVMHEFGLEAAGYFQAAWAISFIYVGIVLNAMAMDYFPRLTASIGDHEQSNRLVNEQTEMMLLLAAPILMAMIALAPLVIHMLYAPSFGPAAEILRWQVLGDILKVASAPIGIVFLASNRGGVYIGIQLIWSAAYLGAFVLGIREIGLAMAGVGFGIAYLILYIAVTVAANKSIGFKPTQRNLTFTILLLLAAGMIMFLATQSALTGYVSGLLATLLVGVYSLRRLDHLIDLTGWLRQKFQ